jgi:hypothetical protein
MTDQSSKRQSGLTDAQLREFAQADAYRLEQEEQFALAITAHLAQLRDLKGDCIAGVEHFPTDPDDRWQGSQVAPDIVEVTMASGAVFELVVSMIQFPNSYRPDAEDDGR